MKASVSPNVSVHMENSVGSTSQKAFLNDVYNKQCLIDLLAVALESNGHTVVKCNMLIQQSYRLSLTMLAKVKMYAQSQPIRISSSCSCICGTIQLEELP